MFLQQAIALFVLKTGAGFSTFDWIATLARDFLEESYIGGAFFFDQASLQWFFVSVVGLLDSRNRSNSFMNIALCDHILRCVYPNDVLPWCDAMGRWEIVCSF